MISVPDASSGQSNRNNLEAREEESDTEILPKRESNVEQIDKTPENPHKANAVDSNETNGDNSDKDVTNSSGSVKLTTLADLIHFCRDRGLQVFNDKPNRPESDKLWSKARNGILRGHRPADRSLSSEGSWQEFRTVSEQTNNSSRRTRSKRSRYSRRSKKSRKSTREDREVANQSRSTATGHGKYETVTSHNDSDSNLTRHKSSGSKSLRRATRATSSRHRSSVMSRHCTVPVGSSCHVSDRQAVTRSSVLSILELYGDNADIDAEEVLKLRMRRKLKRQKENAVEFLDRLQQKHRETQNLSFSLDKLADSGHGNSVDTNVSDTNISKYKEDIGASESPKPNSNTESLEDLENRNAIDADGTCTNLMIDSKPKIVDDSFGTALANTIKHQQNEKINFHSTSDQPVILPVSNEIPSSNNDNDDQDSTFDKGQGHSDNALSNGTECHDNCETVNNGIPDITPKESDPFLNDCSSGAFPSVVTLNRTQEPHSNDAQYDLKNQRVNEGIIIQQCPSATALLNDPTQLISEKVIAQRLMNEMKSHENDYNGCVSKGENTDNNVFLKSANNDVSNSSVSTIQVESFGQNLGSDTKNVVSQRELDLNSELQLDDRSCLGPTGKSQSDSESSCGEKILNYSADIISDKKSHISNVDQQQSINEHFKFQEIANLDTFTNKTETKEIFHSENDNATVGSEKQHSKEQIKSRLQGREREKITVSLNDDSLIVEKQILNDEDNNCNSQNSNLAGMELNHPNKNNGTTPKKSYGNGFLISADVHVPDVRSEERRVSVGNHENNKRKTDQTEEKMGGKENYISVPQSMSSMSKSRTLSTSTSSAATPLKKIHGAAKLMLLMDQLKQSYQEEELTQQSFLQEIGITRKTLKTNYRKLQNREEIQTESPNHESTCDNSLKIKASEESGNLRIKDDIQNQLDDIKKHDNTDEHKESAKIETPTPENNITNITDENEFIESTDVENKISEQDNASHKIFSETQSENVKNAKAKVDTHWDREGTVYKHIKTGFRYKSMVKDSSKVGNEISKFRQSKLVMGNVPSDNVYIEDARQRYQILQKHNQKHEGMCIVSRPKRTCSRPNTEKARLKKNEESTVRPHTNGDRKAFDDNKGLTNVNVNRTAKHNGETPSRIPIRTRSYQRHKLEIKQNNMDSEVEKLEWERRLVNGYQEYIGSKDNLFNVEASDRRTIKDHRFTNTNQRNSKATSDRKLIGIEFSTNHGYVKKGSPHVRQSQNKEQVSNHLENHRDMSANATASMNGIVSPGESILLKPSPRSSNTSRKTNIPIGKAVEVVQSRNKFYEESVKSKIMPRELRVLKLFEELRKLKFGHKPTTGSKDTGSSISTETIPRTSRKMRDFLMMEYGLSDFLLRYRSNLELNRFLQEPMDYELCSKGRYLYKQSNRKEKAFEKLKQKFYPNSFEVSHQAR